MKSTGEGVKISVRGAMHMVPFPLKCLMNDPKYLLLSYKRLLAKLFTIGQDRAAKQICFFRKSSEYSHLEFCLFTRVESK
jgi:hypothetical protein